MDAITEAIIGLTQRLTTFRIIRTLGTQTCRR
jgi:hypothetical protein